MSLRIWRYRSPYYYYYYYYCYQLLQDPGQPVMNWLVMRKSKLFSSTYCSYSILQVLSFCQSHYKDRDRYSQRRPYTSFRLVSTVAKFFLHTRVHFTHLNKTAAMSEILDERSRVNVKVERGSTFTFTRNLSLPLFHLRT